jgi:hypothetical protein
VRLLAAATEVLNVNGMDAFRSMSLKVLFSCEHMVLAKQGMICTLGNMDKTLEDLMND